MLFHRNVAKHACSISCENVKYIYILRKVSMDFGEIFSNTVVVDNNHNLSSSFGQEWREKNHLMNGEY